MPALRYVQDLFAALDGAPELDFARAARCVRAARRMQLTHGLMCGDEQTAFLAERDPELKSPRQRGKEPSAARRFAGTGDMVCFWVGPLRIPDRDAALVFAADIELPGTSATPWDSGGLRSRVAQHLRERERQELHRRRTMPAPDYRERALAATIFLRHGTPERYLRAEIICDVDPDGVLTAGDLSSFTYEARVPGRVRVKTRSLVYAVARRDAMNAALHELRSWCREWSVPFDLVDGYSRHRTVIDATMDHFVRLGL
jgi:hypothetical protein